MTVSTHIDPRSHCDDAVRAKVVVPENQTTCSTRLVVTSFALCRAHQSCAKIFFTCCDHFSQTIKPSATELGAVASPHSLFWLSAQKREWGAHTTRDDGDEHIGAQ